MIVLLGIDDTANSSSRGTGYHARRLAESMAEHGGAEARAITRHQLLVHPEIRYTSRNSSVCIAFELRDGDASRLFDLASEELSSYCAPTSNACLAIAVESAVAEQTIDFGRHAKTEVLTTAHAHEIAKKDGLELKIVQGTGEGAIGAVAGIGLHASGNDGRYIWLPQLRELKGTYRAHDLERKFSIEVETAKGEKLPPNARLRMVDWLRPIMRRGRAILLAEQEDHNGENRWRVADKQTVKALSD